MKKKLAILVMASLMMVQPVNVFANSNLATARQNDVQVSINDNVETIQAYNIDGYNYFKLRDICKPLNWDVQWDNTLKAVWVDTITAYDTSVVENHIPSMTTINLEVKEVGVFVNGADKELSSCNIDGYNYFKLRDFSDLTFLSAGYEENERKPYFFVEWDSEEQMIVINQMSDWNAEKPLAEQWQRPYTVEEYQEEIVRLVNIEREKVGVAPLEADPLLMEIAMLKATEMWDLEYISHTSPFYGSPTAFAQHYGYIRGVGENITQFGLTPESVITGWMNSEGHKNNILNPNYKFIGTGFYGNEYATKHTTMFS